MRKNLLLLAFVWSCIVACNHQLIDERNNIPSISQDELVHCYEESVKSGNWKQSQLVPPEFSLQWDKLSFNQKLSVYEVPIKSVYEYRVGIPTYANGISSVTEVPIRQTLSIGYNADEELESFLVSYFPNKVRRLRRSVFSGYILGVSLKHADVAFLIQVNDDKVSTLHDRRESAFSPEEKESMKTTVFTIAYWKTVRRIKTIPVRSDGEDEGDDPEIPNQDPVDHPELDPNWNGLCPECFGVGCPTCQGPDSPPGGLGPQCVVCGEILNYDYTCPNGHPQ